jgi:hypothetical protein
MTSKTQQEARGCLLPLWSSHRQKLAQRCSHGLDVELQHPELLDSSRCKGPATCSLYNVDEEILRPLEHCQTFQHFIVQQWNIPRHHLSQSLPSCLGVTESMSLLQLKINWWKEWDESRSTIVMEEALKLSRQKKTRMYHVTGTVDY